MHVAVINEGCRLRVLVKNCLIEKGGVEIDNPENVTSVCLTLIFEKYFKIQQKSISKHLEDSQIDASLEGTMN